MVYATSFTYLLIYWLVGISCRDGFVLGSWNSIIINLMAIVQKIIYTLSSSCINRIITVIIFDCNLPHLLLLFIILGHMCLTTFSDKYKPPLNAVEIVVSKVLMFHENIELLPSVYFYDLYPGNNYPNEHITLVLVGIPVINQPEWVEVAK